MANAPRPSRVLLADDEAHIREPLRLILQAAGYEVLEAADGEEAWRQVLDFQPDVVLTDVMMPRLNGFGLCRRIRDHADTWRTPVVVVTSLNTTSDRVAGIEAGADDFLHKPPSREELLARVRSLVRLKHLHDSLEEASNVIEALAHAVEAKDRYTEGHTERVSSCAAMLGKAVGLEDEVVASLVRGGVLHDIGKIGTPESILNKPGALTPEEFRAIQEHSIAGHEICKPLRSLHAVLPMIRWHHEKLDGSGYPDGLKGDAIPVPVRIITIADIFDALRTRRPYKEAFTAGRSIEILEAEAAAGRLDRDLVGVFVREVAARLAT